VNSTCTSGASGSITLGVDNTTGYSYIFKGYITKDGVNYYVTNYYYSYGDGYDEDGNGLILIIVLILVFSLVGFWRLEAAVIFGGLSLLLVSIMGIIAIPIAYTVGVFALSLVAAYLISDRRSAT
jgi:hypothetical protein